MYKLSRKVITTITYTLPPTKKDLHSQIDQNMRKIKSFDCDMQCELECDITFPERNTGKITFSIEDDGSADVVERVKIAASNMVAYLALYKGLKFVDLNSF